MNHTLSTKRNLAANFAGKAWTSVINLVFVPLYIRLLGMEAYGLIGVYASIMALISVLDLGLSTVINREMARLSALARTEQSARDLVYTLEIVYWAITALIALGCIALAPYIAHYWLHPKSFSPATIAQIIVIMGLVLIFQWPDSLYTGGLMGLQRQVQLNVIRAVVATCQGVGAVLILTLLSRSIQAFFLWQLCVCAVQTLLLRAYLIRALPDARAKPRFRSQIWRDHWRFAAGVSGITLASTVVTQLDKAVLSRMLSLEMFGYYALAGQIAGALSFVTGPVFAATFPRFSQLIACAEMQKVKRLYHLSCQFLAAIIFPAWIIIVLFSSELLTLYLHDAQTVAHVRLFLVGLATGVSINALLVLPYTLQLASGWTRLTFFKTCVAALCTLPLLLWMIRIYGAVGASYVRAILNGSYILIEIPIMHQRLLKSEMWRWYLVDLGVPLVVSVSLGILARALLPIHAPRLLALFWIPAVFTLTALAIVSTVPALRQQLTRLTAQRSRSSVTG